MAANDIQVGGSHYKTEGDAPQHWDIIDDNNIGYLEGCATKYVCRCWKKNGLEDLGKSEHYIDKLAENASFKCRRPQGRVESYDFERFAQANDLCPRQRMVCAILLGAWTADRLMEAKAIIAELAEERKNAAAYF